MNEEKKKASAAAAAAAWLLLGVVNRVVFSFFGSADLEHHLVDLGQHLGVGVVAAACVFCGNQLPTRLRPLALFVLATLLLVPATHDDLPGLTRKAAEATGASVLVLHALLALGLAVVVVVTAALVRRATRAWQIALCLLAGLAIYAAHQSADAGDNQGLHVFGSALAALLLLPLCTKLGTKLPFRRVPRVVVVAAAVAGAAAGAAAFFFAARDPELLASLQTFGGNAPALFLSGAEEESVAISPETRQLAGPFFAPRDKLPAVKPSAQKLIADDAGPPIVILATIDSLRADVLADEEMLNKLPTLRGLKERAADFENARTPGSSTYYSLSTLSTGRYFSQQYWTPNESRHGDLWLQDDKQVHFAQLLQKRGVQTHLVSGFYVFDPKLGMMKGFSTWKKLKDGKRQLTRAKLLTDKVLEHLEEHAAREQKQQQQQPLFVYVHYFDLHFPYTVAGPEGKPKERYLRCAEALDQELARLVAAVDDPKRKSRVLLLLSADHGEEFREHGTEHHSRTLYEQLLHVPLLAVGPQVSARKIEQHVGLIDVGPTILDVFGVDTPAVFMGQSLVPLLAGGERTFERPLISEGRKMRSIVMPDNIKVIVDRRRHTTRVFDLVADPAEKKPLQGPAAERGRTARELLDLFFDVHQNKTPGYTPPLRL